MYKAHMLVLSLVLENSNKIFFFNEYRYFTTKKTAYTFYGDGTEPQVRLFHQQMLYCL